MALLDSCLCCSLMVASFVIGVYALVAYVIAFAVELWWIVESEGGLPAPAHLLCAGYFVSLVLCAVLLHGLTVRRGLCLVVWLVGVAALALPEAGMVLYMALQYWRLQSLYGLTEITCWACRLFINVAGVVSVQSLYSSWREESEVMRRLRDLNMSSTMSTSSGRRGSVASSNGVAHGLGHSLGHGLGHGYGQGYGQGFGQCPGHGLGLAFQNEGFVGSMSQLNGKPPGGTYSVPLQPLHSTKLKRSVSSASRRSTASAMSLSTMVPMAPMYNGSMYGYANPMLAQPMLSPLQAAGPGGGPYPLRRTDSTSEFNAAAFDGILAASLRGADAVDVVDGRPPARAARAQSLGDLSRAGGSRLGDYWRVESTTAPSRPVAYMLPSTRSLDRRPRRALSMADLHALQALVPMHGVPCYPDAGALVYPPALMLYRGATSKTSLGAASDDFRRYRDVAL